MYGPGLKRADFAGGIALKALARAHFNHLAIICIQQELDLHYIGCDSHKVRH
ncbi:hypothetical protein J577_3014 [Acinetobacter sp. 263903-1]|nr:hypothetical protein J550_2542 [Acinetobacter sp. 230853]KCX35447.1 hypothetical protein J577_3014 [Acinetobacter sp. 263903-1]